MKTPFSYNVIDRIGQVLTELIHCIEYATEIKYRNISASLFYNFDTDPKHWYMIERNYCDAFGGAIHDAVVHPESFARCLYEEYDGSLCILWDKYKDGAKHKDKKSKKRVVI